jgi:hypothetical protein
VRAPGYKRLRRIIETEREERAKSFATGGETRAITAMLDVTPRCFTSLGVRMSQDPGYEDGPDDAELELELDEEALDPVGALSFDDDPDLPE